MSKFDVVETGTGAKKLKMDIAMTPTRVPCCADDDLSVLLEEEDSSSNFDYEKSF